MRSASLVPKLALVALCALMQSAYSYELYNDEQTQLNADLRVSFGAFATKRHYDVRREDGYTGGYRWQEAIAKYGFSGNTRQIGAGLLYGGINLLSSGTWGDGDPAGWSTGHERRTALEDAFVGWKSGDAVPALGPDGIDFSVGRQNVHMGSGFLIDTDGTNLGDGYGPVYDRGGANYLALRQAFSRTAVLKLGGDTGLHGSAMWLKSDVALQGKAEMVAGTLDYTAEPGTVGLSYLRVRDVDTQYTLNGAVLERKGMNTYTLRAEGNAGVEGADFAFEYARQEKRMLTTNAWYADIGYTFADVAWKPSISFRHTRYGNNYDMLFQGFFRFRYQGEISSNYTFAYGSNAKINDVALAVRPSETVTSTLAFFDYKTLRYRAGEDNLDAKELVLYTDWVVTSYFTFSPIVGVYKPRLATGNGGLQVGSAKPNPYVMLLGTLTF